MAQFYFTRSGSLLLCAQHYDLILANAALQWVPQHDVLFPRLVSRLAPDGNFAVQMPDNLDEPAHRLLRDIAADGPWAARLKGVERTMR